MRSIATPLLLRLSSTRGTPAPRGAAFAYMPAHLTELTDATLPGVVANSRIPLMLVFHSRASRPARQLVALIEELAPSYSGMMELALASVEQCPRALDNYGILTLPTCLAFRQGRQTDRFTGLLTKERLAERLEQALQAV